MIIDVGVRPIQSSASTIGKIGNLSTLELKIEKIFEVFVKFPTFKSYAIGLSPEEECKGFKYDWEKNCEAYNQDQPSLDALVACITTDNPELEDCDDWIFDTKGKCRK